MSKEIVLEILNNRGLSKVMLITDDGKVPYKGKDGKTVRGIPVPESCAKRAQQVKQSVMDELINASFTVIDDNTLLVSDWRNHNTVLDLTVTKFPKYCISTGKLPVESQYVVVATFKDVVK